MSDENISSKRTDRRSVLSALGTGLAVSLGATGTATADSDSSGGRPAWASASGSDPAPSGFHVEGTQTIQTKFTPTEVIQREQKRSPALKRRYDLDKPILESTQRVERPDAENDDHPMHETYIETRPWDTYFAAEDEWTDHFDSSGVSTAGRAPAEKNNPYGVWEYNEIGGGYEIAAPMNVISPETIPDVAGVLDNNGYTLAVVQWDRWAWNSATNQFETQHKSAATGVLGVLGRKHIRMWEFEGYVTASAHIDSDVPHEATSYEDAEQHVEGVFDGASNWYGFDDYYALNNGSKLDHDGSATELWKA